MHLGVTDLWDDSLVNMRVFGGASAFRAAIQATVHGHEKPIKSLITEYNSWSKSIVDSFELIHSIRTHGREPDDFDDDDDFDLDPGEGRDSIEDAEMLRVGMLDGIQETYRRLEESFKGLISKCEAELTEDNLRGIL